MPDLDPFKKENLGSAFLSNLQKCEFVKVSSYHSFSILHSNCFLFDFITITYLLTTLQHNYLLGRDLGYTKRERGLLGLLWLQPWQLHQVRPLCKRHWFIYFLNELQIGYNLVTSHDKLCVIMFILKLSSSPVAFRSTCIDLNYVGMAFLLTLNRFGFLNYFSIHLVYLSFIWHLILSSVPTTTPSHPITGEFRIIDRNR